MYELGYINEKQLNNILAYQNTARSVSTKAATGATRQPQDVGPIPSTSAITKSQAPPTTNAIQDRQDALNLPPSDEIELFSGRVDGSRSPAFDMRAIDVAATPWRTTSRESNRKGGPTVARDAAKPSETSAPEGDARQPVTSAIIKESYPGTTTDPGDKKQSRGLFRRVVSYNLREGNPDDRLDISYKWLSWSGYGDFEIRRNGRIIGKLDGVRQLRDGWRYSLEDGSIIELRLDVKALQGTSELLISRDGRPLEGTAADPRSKIDRAANLLKSFAKGYVVLGIIIILFSCASFVLGMRVDHEGLYRLLGVILMVIGAVHYAYGWGIGDGSFESVLQALLFSITCAPVLVGIVTFSGGLVGLLIGDVLGPIVLIVALGAAAIAYFSLFAALARALRASRMRRRLSR